MFEAKSNKPHVLFFGLLLALTLDLLAVAGVFADCHRFSARHRLRQQGSSGARH